MDQKKRYYISQHKIFKINKNYDKFETTEEFIR